MTRTLSRLALYAAVASTFLATTAQAVPMVFQFSGTVRETFTFDESGQSTSDYSQTGQAVQASIFVETDGLRSRRFGNASASSLLLEDQLSDPVEWITSTLSIGGVGYDVGLYGNDGGYMFLIDGFADQFSVADNSTESPASGYADGAYRFRSLEVGWYDPFGLRDWITLTDDFGVNEILALPMDLTFFGSVYESTETCANFICSITEERTTVFDLTSVTRTVLPVPEPGTLGMLAFAFVALIVSFGIRRDACAARG